MKIYLSGIEYYTYRNIMKSIGVKYGCLNYEYIWSRTPRFNLEEECSFLDELIVYPGNLKEYCVDEYVDFLNRHADKIKFAIELFAPARDMLTLICNVDIVPCHIMNVPEYQKIAVYPTDLRRPFMGKTLKKFTEEGMKIHGINCELSFFDSVNSGTWMRGKAGWTSVFDAHNKITKLKVVGYKEQYIRSAIARGLIEEGYNLNLNNIKRNDWKEVAKLNGIAWKKYSDYMEGI